MGKNGITVGKRPLGRPIRWGDNIKVDLNETDCEADR
jgi:hypothetical protein